MFTIRKATPDDSSLIFDLITQLAVYEKMENDVVTTVEELRENVFSRKYAEVIIAEEDGVPVGFALYFFNFSTFVGKPGLYLEDLYVKPAHRGKGYGKKLFAELSKIAVSKNCGRMEWSVLDWNTPAIKFYESLGAKPMDEWTVFRLGAKEIAHLAE
ncbi:GNAT family N-acetyltransferase [Kaistella palustris]|uniref:GNAT family N-acetyltransferase n=1 Tax=Kaistella palustris TaxID=493376 RepID=UPI0003FB1F46|nr:GNAT family N-acetyltransferase [Kaistella palustris]